VLAENSFQCYTNRHQYVGTRVVDQLTDDADSHNNAKRYKEVVKMLDPRFESSLSIFLPAIYRPPGGCVACGACAWREKKHSLLARLPSNFLGEVYQILWGQTLILSPAQSRGAPNQS
jgi:hypothetical protein